MASDSENNPTDGAEDPDYWAKRNELKEKGVKLFSQIIYRDWCKACGICIAFCPKQVYDRDESGKPVAARPDDCINCLFCELHCPDFAITIKDRYPDRRKEDR